MKSIRVQVAEEKLYQIDYELSKLDEEQAEERNRLNSIKGYYERIIKEPNAAAAHAWTSTTNLLNRVLKQLSETNPIQVVSACDRIEKFLLEEGIVTEEDIRREL